MSWVQQVHNAAVVARSLGCQLECDTEMLGVGAPRPPSCPPPPADTPQGLAACFAAFYPGSPAKAKFQQFVLDNTLCPRHVLNMPVEKFESMLQQHGFEGVVVFTFQSRLREVCLPAAARGA